MWSEIRSVTFTSPLFAKRNHNNSQRNHGIRISAHYLIAHYLIFHIHYWMQQVVLICSKFFFKVLQSFRHKNVWRSVQIFPVRHSATSRWSLTAFSNKQHVSNKVIKFATSEMDKFFLLFVPQVIPAMKSSHSMIYLWALISVVHAKCIFQTFAINEKGQVRQKELISNII